MSCKAKILVTGAKGQLGRELQSIVGSGWYFTDVDELDICSKEAVDAYVTSNHIDTIVNCAAYTNVDRAEDEPQEAERINSDAVALLADVARRHNIRLIHISTDYVFAGNGTKRYIAEIIADKMEFIERKSDIQKQPTNMAQMGTDVTKDAPFDEEVPF